VSSIAFAAGAVRWIVSAGTQHPRGAAAALALAASFAASAPAMAQTFARPETGPYDILLLAASAAPDASGRARLFYAASPFGIAVTADGHAIYDVRLTLEGLPSASSLGAFATYVAWAASIDLSRWIRLGEVSNGTAVVGPVQLDKFLVVITAEASASQTERSGPVVLRGMSPSAWLQSFLAHPLFRVAR
jgi:hypothetical protein